MAISPAPSATRGTAVLQPSYFSSSLYIGPLRDDIAALVLLFHDQYTQATPASPFALFKSIWSSQGWKWLHFAVFDDRSRHSLLHVTARLFIERLDKAEPPLTQVVALFGLYTFLYTQPKKTSPPLIHITHVPIPLDCYLNLKALPQALDDFIPLRPQVVYLISILLQDKIFLILPHSDHHPSNPRELPREIVVDRDAAGPAPKKKGRPTGRDRAKKARAALDDLNQWLEETEGRIGARTSGATVFGPDSSATLQEYRALKSAYLEAIERPEYETMNGRAALEEANKTILMRLQDVASLISADEIIGTEGRAVGIGRIRRAVEELQGNGERRGGILALLEGAGRCDDH